MLGNHLLGIYEKALSPDNNLAGRLSRVRSLGFDFVEMSVDETDERLARLDFTNKELFAFKRAVHDTKTPILSMCLSAHRRFPFGSVSAATRDRAQEIMVKAILLASAVGVRVVQLAGYDVYYEDSTPKSVARFEEGLALAVKEAERRQVMLAMEIMDTPFMNSISKYIELKKKIDSPWFKLYPDLGNLSAWGGDVEKELNLGMRDIVGVHLKDTIAVTGSSKGKFRDVPFGTGCVDFVKCFQTLERGGYTGPYLIEMWHQEGKNDLEATAEALEFIKAQFAKAEEDF